VLILCPANHHLCAALGRLQTCRGRIHKALQLQKAPRTVNGKQYRRKAGSRSWEQAEEAKRRIEDELAGRTPVTPESRMVVAEAVKVFMQAKRNDGLEPPTIAKLQKTCYRIQEFCETAGVFTLEGVSLIHLTTWPWERYSNTTHSLRTNQERVKSFFLHFHNAGVIAKNPTAAWKRIKGKTEQASGFTQKEYEEIMQTAKRLGNAKTTCAGPGNALWRPRHH
jgi:integrase/recombinase XerD